MLTPEKKLKRPLRSVQWTRTTHEISITRELHGALQRRDVPMINELCKIRPPADSIVLKSLRKTESLSLLLSAGLNVNRIIIQHSRMPLLTVAVNGGHLEAVLLLLKAGANINPTESHPLYHCTRQDIAIVLINAGVDVNMSSSSGWTPLLSACSGQRAEVARVLLDYGAAVDASSQAPVPPSEHFKSRAIHHACRNSSLPCVRLLVEAGAAIEKLPHEVTSPLISAVLAFIPNPELIAYLLEQGANPRVTCIDGKTPLEHLQDRYSPLRRVDYFLIASTLIAAGSPLPPATDEGKWNFLRVVANLEMHVPIATVIEIFKTCTLNHCVKLH